jgi:hypothetical protein
VTVTVCAQNDNLNTAAKLVWDNDCGCVPVICPNGKGTIVGRLSDCNICMAAYTQDKSLIELPVDVAMAHSVLSLQTERRSRLGRGYDAREAPPSHSGGG